MSATAVQPALELFVEGPPDGAASGQGGLTLGERISSAWEGLLRTGAAPCPVCRGRMERVSSVGRCPDCGSVIS